MMLILARNQKITIFANTQYQLLTFFQIFLPNYDGWSINIICSPTHQFSHHHYYHYYMYCQLIQILMLINALQGEIRTVYYLFYT